MINIFNQLPGRIAWKDQNHHYLGCNQNFANAHNFKYCEDIIGRSDIDFAFISEEELTFYLEYDQLALSGKTLQLIHSNIGSPKSTKLFQLQKRPLLNNDNRIIGTLFHCFELANNELISKIIKHDKKHQHLDLGVSHYLIGPNENSYNLSTRELECLFCTLRGMTAKKIADALQLSKRTVEFYFENIKNKFGCISKSELLVQAINKGYMKIIPQRFLNSDMQQIFD